MRIRMLGVLASLFIVLLVALAVVLVAADFLANTGDSGGAAVLRYVGLGVGCLFVVDAVCLVLYLVFLVATWEMGAANVQIPAAEPTSADLGNAAIEEAAQEDAME